MNHILVISWIEMVSPSITSKICSRSTMIRVSFDRLLLTMVIAGTGEK